MIRTEHMTVGYRGVPLIRDIDICVRKGEILSLIGPNGAGKSTILKSIIRQLALIAGTVYLDNRAMRDLPERTVAQSMSVLMTERIQPELMTCGDVVGTGRYPYTGRLGILSADDRRKVREAMALVHAEELYDCDFSQISLHFLTIIQKKSWRYTHCQFIVNITKPLVNCIKLSSIGNFHLFSSVIRNSVSFSFSFIGDCGSKHISIKRRISSRSGAALGLNSYITPWGLSVRAKI